MTDRIMVIILMCMNITLTTYMMVYFLDKKAGFRWKSRIAYYCSLAALSVSGIFAQLFLYWPFSTILQMGTVICFALFLYQGSLSYKLRLLLFLFFLDMAFSYLLEVPLIFIEKSGQNSISSTFYYGLMNGITMLEILLVQMLVRRKETYYYIEPRLSPLFLIVFLGVVVSDTVIIRFLQNAASGAEMQLGVIALIAQPLILLLIYLNYGQICREMDRSFLAQMELEKRNSQRLQAEQVESMHQEMQKWKHDFQNHIAVLYGTLENNDPQGAAAYLEKLQSGLSGFRKVVKTGKQWLDAMVNAKMILAENRQITFDYQFENCGAIGADDTDMTVLMGNLLDNALEACEYVTEKRYIRLVVKVIKNTVMIHIENTTDGYQQSKNGFLQTRKAGRGHGLGIGQIDRIVARYEGKVSRRHENQIFETDITMPNGRLGEG